MTAHWFHGIGEWQGHPRCPQHPDHDLQPIDTEAQRWFCPIDYVVWVGCRLPLIKAADQSFGDKLRASREDRR